MLLPSSSGMALLSKCSELNKGARLRLCSAVIPRMDVLEDKPCGLREFALIDVDGNLLRIGEII